MTQQREHRRDPERLAEVKHVAEEVREDLDRRNPNWEAEVLVAVAILLGLALPDQLLIGNRWIVPACEAVLLVGLIASTPHRPDHEHPHRRLVRILLIAFVSAVNIVALFLLAQSLLGGGKQDGHALLRGGGVLWLTAVLIFAVWFWELDRGGPVRRLLGDDWRPDIIFPPMADDRWTPDKWQPGLGDYLYLSLTNAASFSPPEETMPVTGMAKLLLSIQTLASLTTLTIVLSYAVNNLN
jgi:hypothetical protein